ncbi:hypothetical protein pkur_cds_28 [Pandoravirus kuranda]|uniref:Uncharacterized protein n=1 Tax=Pandoravirus kuranda TaxID=3019033 RepID=A0AA95J408_9VIRU|nr:hypothetical protein pkur_cds_28 [Pandoravirus kuranda]
MATETRTCTTPLALLGTEPKEQFCLSQAEFKSMIAGERVSLCSDHETDGAPTATASDAAVDASLSGSAQSDAPFGAPDSVEADTTPPPTNMTMTIADLCEMVGGMDDPDAHIETASVVETVVMRFRLGTEKCRVQDGVRITQRIDTARLVASDLSGCAAISFVGKEPISARALLAALEPCLDRHGDVRVCVRQDRAVTRLRKTVKLCTDSVLFKDDHTSIADAAKVCDITQAGETLIRVGEMSMERIAATLSGLMPRHWTQTYYCLGGTLLTDLKSVYKRLPGIDKKALSELFVPIGNAPSLHDDNDHGNVVIWTPVPGLTYTALESAYGPSASKVNLLLSMARAAQAPMAADDRIGGGSSSNDNNTANGNDKSASL